MSPLLVRETPRRPPVGKLSGSFVVATGTTTVPLNAPYRLRQFDDRVVLRTGTTTPILMLSATA